MNATKAIASVVATALLVGCATQPSNVQAIYVSSMKYEGYDCRRLAREAEEVTARLQQVTGTLQTKANTDAALVGVGLVLFWPALLALPATGGKAEEQELARLKGETEALTRAIKERNCDSPKTYASASQSGIVPVSLTTAAPTPNSDAPSAANSNASNAKYLYSAEQFAKANGCSSPVAKLNFASPNGENFTVMCAQGEPVAVRCEFGQCRALK